MSSEVWTCFECESPLPVGSGVCTACGAVHRQCEGCEGATPADGPRCILCGHGGLSSDLATPPETPSVDLELKDLGADSSFLDRMQRQLGLVDESLAPVPASPPGALAADQELAEPESSGLTELLERGVDQPLAAAEQAVESALGTLLSTPAIGRAMVSVEFDSGQQHKVRQKSLARFRVRTAPNAGAMVIRFSAECRALGVCVNTSVSVGPGGIAEVPPASIEPRLPGAECLQILVEAQTPDRAPIGAWRGQTVLNIAAEEKERTIIAGGNVNLIEDRGVQGGAFGLGAGLASGPGAMEAWLPQPLMPDRERMARVELSCPEQELSPPSSLADGDAKFVGRRCGRLLLRAPGQPVMVLAVVIGDHASMGRGGQGAVDWWLDPEPWDDRAHGRLSRRHATIELRAGRAFVTDSSQNGTEIGAQRLPKGEPSVLCEGDTLTFAGGIPMRAGLQGAGDRVHAVTFDRVDALASRLVYALSDGTSPMMLPLRGPGGPWFVAWRQDEAGEVCPAFAGASQDSEATALQAGVWCEGAGASCRWIPMDGPCEQQQLLGVD